MFVIQLWLIFGLTILGAVARGLPEVDERDTSGLQTYPRGSNEDQSSGKLNCTDCGPLEGTLGAAVSLAVPDLSTKHPYSTVHTSTYGDPSSDTSQKNKKTSSVQRNRKGRHRNRNRKGKSKPVISSSGITLNTKNGHATSAQLARENTDTTLKDFKENVQQHTGVNHKKEETRKLAANIQHNIKRLGEISSEIKKLIKGNVDTNLTLRNEDSVIQSNAKSSIKYTDFHLENKPVRKHKNKKVGSAEETSKNNHENSDGSDTKIKGDKHEKDVHDIATNVHGYDQDAVLGENPGGLLGRAPAVADKDGKPGHTDTGEVDDRWSRPGLSQVPDAARLERRLHPTIDAPIRDIMRSLSNMLYTLQGSIHRADYDYHYVFNSTRWTLMVGVRERLKKLVVQNDKVYDTVLQASLLTKEIYRRAHEQRLHGSPVSPAAIMSREPVISTVYLRPLHVRVVEEVEQARRLKSFITSTITQRSDLLLEFARVQRRLEERLPTRALQDLERRARQAQGLLQSAHAQRDARDGLNLFRHMYGNMQVNMEAARNMTRTSWEELMVAKRKSMESKAVAGRIMKRYRDRVPGSRARTPFDHMRVVLWSKVDIATLHADDLFKAAAEIHVELGPMLGKAKLVLANYDRDPLSKRIQKVADDISSNLKLLRRVMDKITLSLKAEHLVMERCEELEGEGSGSAGYYDDDMTSLIDCDEYIMVQSGDSEEGSGELEGVLVDIDTPTMGNASLLIKGDNPNLEPVDIDITDMTNVSSTTLDGTDELYIDEDLDGKIVLPDETPDDQNKVVDVKLANGTGKPVTKSGVKNAILIPGDSDDEDIIKEALRTHTAATTTVKSTKAKPNTDKHTTAKPDTVNPAATKKQDLDKPTTVKQPTTEPTEVTTKPTTTTTKGAWSWWSLETTTLKGDFSISNFFGFNLDEPVRDVVMEIEETDVSNLTFNEVLRLRLSTYAISSKAIYENASLIKERSDELSATWDKLRSRFGRFEIRTLEARLFTERWAAEQAVFTAVHDRVLNVMDDVNLKEEVVKSQTVKAVDKAERKLEQMEARYKSRSEQADKAADPKVVKEARESVARVKDDVSKLVQLTRLVPAPCKVAAGIQRGLKANISELRRKIEQAKLIASSLQVPMQLDGSAHISVPLQHNTQTSPLGTRLDMLVKVTDTDGPVVAVETKDTGSFALLMKDKTARVVAFDEDKYETDDLSTDVQLEGDTWYRLVLERLARTFNLTVYNASSGELLSHGDAFFDDGDVTVTQSSPSVVYIGGLPDDFSDYGRWSGCIGSLLLDGQMVSLVRQDSAGKLPAACSSERALSYRRSNLMLDGSGFAHYDLDPIVRSQRAMHSVGITFRPFSAGLVLSLSNRRLGVYVRAALEQDQLVVHVQMARGPVLIAVSKLPIQASHYKLEVHLNRRPKVSIDGSHLVLKPADRQGEMRNSASEGLYVGMAPTYNRSMIGCVRSITINKQSLLLAGAVELQGGTFGTCRDRSCVMFTKGSTAISRKGMKDAASLLIAFTFGSAGPLVQYVKKEKFDVTVSVDNTTLEVFDVVSDVTENVPLEGYSEGDLVVLTLEDKDSKVVTRAGDASVSVEYKGGGAWWGGDDGKKDGGSSSYSLAVGGSTETEDTFHGRITEVLINGKSMDLSAHIEENSLGFCKSQSRVVSHWRDKPVPEETSTC